KGGDAFNVIPERVEIEGTVRTLNEKTRKKIKDQMKRISEKITSSYNCKLKFFYDSYSPCVRNDYKFTEIIEKTSRKILDKKYFYKSGPSMGGEDFAFYSQKIPSTYIFIGCGKKSGVHHSSKFNLDERVIPFAVKYLSNLILNIKFKKEK
ncbi:MAG: M20/M25/M40 family metallo-hydrolase, partial [bacterium]|nr:M20/M25/M40 family metallo-hydrolase [bacterium]MDW8164634.1 M20/M25/M40 family metallo-hydrolase [Candidatus Omnitrophota bacterium]